jgi:hypothetical protein
MKRATAHLFYHPINNLIPTAEASLPKKNFWQMLKLASWLFCFNKLSCIVVSLSALMDLNTLEVT